jgi:hypothetical protein
MRLYLILEPEKILSSTAILISGNAAHRLPLLLLTLILLIGLGITSIPTAAESGHKSNYSAKIDCTTSDVSVASNDFTMVSQRIEGYNFIPFVTKTAYLSFWVKATKTGIYCIRFRNSGFDRSYIAEYTVNTTATWERKVITIPFDFSGGTWDYTNGTGLSVDWILMSGSSFHTTPNTWHSGDYMATSNQVNACDSTANDFYLAQVQLRTDNPSIFIVDRLIDKELIACQRYYEVIGGDVASHQIRYDIYTDTATRTYFFPMFYRVTKRGVPTITKNGTWATTNAGQPTISNAGLNSCRIQFTAAGAAGITSIRTDSTDDTVTLDSEL